ncbi:hypothetical protein KJZ99_00575 [bacterium]|nr:hypothetical protein [bacterium]
MKALIVLIWAATAFGALPSTEVKKGNDAAKARMLDEAQYHYVKALENEADTAVVMYNLGNALFDAGEFERAQQLYSAAIDTIKGRSMLSSTLYNMGTASILAQDYDKAIGALVETLRQNPADQDAKVNLELALRLKREQEQQQDQNQQEENQQRDQSQDKNQEQKQDQNGQQQEQSEKQEDSQQEQQQQQPGSQENQQGDSTEAQQSRPQPQQMTKEEAEQLLNALLQSEQKTLEEVRKAKAVSKKKKERDW